MFNWEIFWSVLLAVLAAKLVGHITVGITYGHVQDSIRQLDGDIGARLNNFSQNIVESIEGSTFRLSDKLDRLDGGIDSIEGELKKIDDKVYDIREHTGGPIRG